jgi:hypothetical protein
MFRQLVPSVLPFPALYRSLPPLPHIYSLWVGQGKARTDHHYGKMSSSLVDYLVTLHGGSVIVSSILMPLSDLVRQAIEDGQCLASHFE